MSKPFEPAALLQAIDEVIARPLEQRRDIREEERARAALLRLLEVRFA